MLPALFELPDLPEPWPLFLFLHGKGERGPGGDDLDRVRQWGPPKQIAEGASIPGLLVSPQCPLDRFWRTDEVLALLDDVQGRYPIDRRRVYLTGLSMGGTGSWDLLAAAPDRFAAAFIICGRTDLEQAPKITDVPIQVFHGALDPIIPLSDSVTMVDAVRRAGGQVDLTVYPEAAHVEAWVQAYGAEGGRRWHTWLMQHTREV
ncbi:MAG: dienelactone hydrolase family protein [Bradymonadia bacterium]